MIPFKNRFHGHNSLSYLYNNGQAARSHFFIVKKIVNPKRKNTRLAIVISKKVLKSAVKRNRVRRRIYEIIRPQIANFNQVYDIVVIVSSSESLTIDHQELVDQLDRMFIELGLK